MHGGGGGERPRELRWYHAAGMLFGDWGTSRLYVLGLAYVMLRGEKTPHASFWYVAAMCVLVTLVGFSYTIICKHFPDGGGVYSASKHRSKSLAVIGALLLIADYIVTAALSSYDGFRYILPNSASPQVALYCAAAAILAIGAMNIYGPKRVGTIALVVAIISAVFYMIVGVACIPHLKDATVVAPTEPLGMQWQHFVGVILALSGVEAIANMTGVMAEPVAKNAKKAIFVVLLEVVILNLVMAYAMNALPFKELGEGAGVTVSGAHEVYAQSDIQDHMLKVLATEYIGPGFAAISAFFFGLLLLSAANTAIGDMVSIQYLMSRDKELPNVFTALNQWGMPWVGLCTATIVPTIVLLYVGADTEMLADLYAIGVVGAITINMIACGTNRQLDLVAWERVVLCFVGFIVAFIEISIAYDKPKALIFAMSVVGAGLTGRFIAKKEWLSVIVAAGGLALAAIAYLVLPYNLVNTELLKMKPEVSHTQAFSFMALVLAGVVAASYLVKPAVPGEELEPAFKPKKEVYESAIRAAISAHMGRLLVPTRGNPKLMKFAARFAKDRNAAVFVLFVREVALNFRERGGSVASEGMTLANDEEAMKIFADARKICDDAGVPMQPLYAVTDSAAELILDHAATLGVDAVIMGVSKRGALWKTLKGDVLQDVVAYLPESIPLLIHA